MAQRNLIGNELASELRGKIEDNFTELYDKISYTAFLTQVGTAAPVPTVLKDDLAVPVWSYSAVGTYTLTKSGAFVVDKTVPTKLESYIDNDGNKYTLERTSADVMTLKTYAAADITTLANGVLLNQLVNIEVYL